MGSPITGNWRATRTIPYAGATVWGTGINPVHADYGSEDLRVTGRQGILNDPGRQPPQGGHDDLNYEDRPPWYQADNVYYYPEAAIVYDGRPRWQVDSPDWRGRHVMQPPYDASGGVKSAFRSLIAGARRGNYKQVDGMPSETVSEGWRNKAHGVPANSVPSDPSQYEVQTSMRQRYQVRNNESAVARGTDEPRSRIASRVTGQKVKYFSGNERHYDMFPYQQDIILRAFWYRRAATGRPADMVPNETYDIEPIQRTPAPDPYLGPQESSLGASYGYGYTSEDMTYA
jgi:hypothetical protein